MSAAGEDPGQEPPTEKRKREAYQRGDRPRSRDLTAAIVTGAGLLGLATLGGAGWAEMRAYLAGALAGAGEPGLRWQPPIPLGLAAAGLLGASLAGVLVAAAISGAPAFGLAAPKANRLDPVAGLKRIFGTAGLIEAAGALIKTVLLSAVVALTAAGFVREASALSGVPLEAAVTRASGMLLGLLALLTGALAVAGGADLPLRVLQWLRRNRMTKQQLRDENRESEGAPELKGAQRRRAREILNRNARAALKTASVVLTNPTEFAVALRYERARDHAPVVVAKGRGVTAQALRDMAAVKGLPVLRQPALARALFFTAKPGEPVREELFVAVATVLAWVMSVERQIRELAEIDVPEALRVDADGRREEA